MFGDSSVQTERCICCDCHWKCKPNHVLSNVCQLLGDGRVCAVPGLVRLRSTGGWQHLWLCVQDWVTAAIAVGRLCQIQPPQVWPIRTFQKKIEISMKATIQLKQMCTSWMLFREVNAVMMWNCTQTKHRHAKPDKTKTYCFTLSRCHDTASTTLEIRDKTLRCWHITKYICINKDKWD